MKTYRLPLTGLILCLAQSLVSAQPDTAAIRQKALLFADSLVKADAYETWNVYADLVVPSVIKYYGGKDAYIEYIKKARSPRISTEKEDPALLRSLDLLTENEE